MFTSENCKTAFLNFHVAREMAVDALMEDLLVPNPQDKELREAFKMLVPYVVRSCVSDHKTVEYEHGIGLFPVELGPNRNTLLLEFPKDVSLDLDEQLLGCTGQVFILEDMKLCHLVFDY